WQGQDGPLKQGQAAHHRQGARGRGLARPVEDSRGGQDQGAVDGSAVHHKLELDVQFVVLSDQRIDGRVARAPAAVARGQIKLPAVHRAPNRTNGTLAPTLQHPADQRPLAVGTGIVQSIESPLVMEQRDADAVPPHELAAAVRYPRALAQKNRGAYAPTWRMAE